MILSLISFHSPLPHCAFHNLELFMSVYLLFDGPVVDWFTVDFLFFSECLILFYIGSAMHIYKPRLLRRYTVFLYFLSILLKYQHLQNCVAFSNTNTKCTLTCSKTVLLTHGSPIASLVVRICSISHGFEAYPKRFKHSPSKSLDRILCPITARHFQISSISVPSLKTINDNNINTGTEEAFCLKNRNFGRFAPQGDRKLLRTNRAPS